MSTLGEMVLDVNPAASSTSAWEEFVPTIRRWIATAAPHVVLEVGGGRHPMLTPDEARDFGVERYVVNDVSANELAHAPEGMERAHFDIQAGPPPDSPAIGACDLVFAQMVFEHLEDPAGAWASVHQLLRPGGTAISFHPVLFSPPFVVNRLIPERFARKVLQHFFHRRNDDDYPKFPAYYRWCRASTAYMTRRLAPLGFASVEVVPYYGHGYFERVPGLRSVDAAVARLAERRGWTALASYAYVIVTR